MRHHQLLKSQEVADGLGNLRCPQLHLDGNPCAISRVNDAVDLQIVPIVIMGKARIVCGGIHLKIMQDERLEQQTKGLRIRSQGRRASTEQ